MMVAVSYHHVLLVTKELFCLHCLYLSKQSSNHFLPFKEVKLHIFACVAVLQQELTKLHKGTACGEAQRFQHFFVSRYNFYYSKFLGYFRHYSVTWIFALFSRMSPESNDCVV